MIELTIDQGNTMAKAALWSGGVIVGERSYKVLCARDIELLATEAGGRFGGSIYCSVKGSDPAVTAKLGELSGKFVELSSGLELPVGIGGYRSRGSLGVDRIAAAAGAYSRFAGQWILVVDCGTAITYDVVSPTGEFAGGNIAPGVFMRLEALHKFTAKLPLVDPCGAVEDFGTDTVSALRSGAINGVVAELRHYRSLLPSQGTAVVLTGGSAHLVAGRAGMELTVDPQLVMKGLRACLNYETERNIERKIYEQIN